MNEAQASELLEKTGQLVENTDKLVGQLSAIIEILGKFLVFYAWSLPLLIVITLGLYFGGRR